MPNVPLAFRRRSESTRSIDDGCSQAESSFLAQTPAYAATSTIDRLRATEYRRLDAEAHTYLDYTGGSLYAESQLSQHAELLTRDVYGNPHSGNPTSLAMTNLVERTRAHVLEFFNASPDEYVAIFTPNATGALRLVGESFPFTSNSRYLLSVDNHNSVNGIREFARQAGADVEYAPIVAPDLRLDKRALLRALERPTSGPKLFAFPAQSNFSGVQHPLGWIDEAQDRGWDVLLDASAFVPCNRLNLSETKPDFVSMSFYKMFGYPTGLGALLARKSALERLRRPWFSGGTITFSSVKAAPFAGDGFYLTPGVAGFEDGTVNYLGIPAIGMGLQWLESVGLGIIHTRTAALTRWLIDALSPLRHDNGQPLIHLYGPRDVTSRGATVAMNFVEPDGKLWDCWEIERLANAQRLSLRAGCHCNPGAREVALDLSEPEMASYFRGKTDRSYDDFRATLEPGFVGVVRVSLGIASNFADVYKFVQFAREFANRAAP